MTLAHSLFNAVLFVSLIYQCSANDGDQYWYDEQIVPNILSSVPPSIAQVVFGNHFQVIATVATGQTLSLPSVAAQPYSISYPYNSNDLYTMIMFDPDVPNAWDPSDSQYAQWISVNNQGQSANGFNVGYTGQAIAPYESPNPVKNSGKHRYIILVYLQSYRINVETLTQRIHFNVNSFAEQNGLGSAIAGNFFIAYAAN